MVERTHESRIGDWRVKTELSCEELYNKLKLLVEAQKEELRKQRFPTIYLQEIEEGKVFEYKVSEQFRRIYLMAINYLLRLHSVEKIEEFNSDLVGALFQDITYVYLASNEPTAEILLPPDKTRDFYHLLYPHAPEIPHPLGLDSLGGIYVPDGLLVEDLGGRMRITATCEYTLSPRPQTLRNGRFELAQTKRNWPSLLDPDARFLLIIPKPEDEVPGSWQGRKTKVILMPFDSTQFANFFNSIYSSYTPNGDDETATLADIQAEANY